MTLELARTVVNFNGVPVPGFFRNGTFLGETSIETFVVFRSGPIANGQPKSFTIEVPCKPRTVMVLDTNSDTVYTFTVSTAEGAVWTMVFAANNPLQVAVYGNTKVINFPVFVLEKGAKVSLSVNKNISLFTFFTNLSYNIEADDF